MLNGGQDMSHVPSSLSQGAAPSIVPGHAAAPPSVPQVPPAVLSRRRMTLGQFIAVLLGIAFTIGDLATNATYLLGQGRTSVDVGAMGWIAGCFGVGLVFIPWVLGRLWRQRRFGWFLVTLAGGGILFMAALLSAAGFVNSNFGDTEAARAAALRQRAALQSDLDDLRAERARLSAAKFERATQAQVDAAAVGLCQPRPSGSERPECKDKRIYHTSLQERLTKTSRADALDDKIPRMQRVLDDSSNVKDADPQVTAVVLMFSRLSRGNISIEPRDVEAGRLLTFVFLPLLAGLFFACADLLGEPYPKPQREVTVLRSVARRPSIEPNQAEVAFA